MTKMIFPVWFLFLMNFLFVSTIQPAFGEEDDEMGFLLFEKIPEVYTASKRSENIFEAPSVIYVITRSQIEYSGARTLAEIIKRVPGMSTGLRESTLIGSRGFTSDQNDKFVILIDGTKIQNIVQDGTYNYADMPNLDMVDRIEVVKGPSSTLWGSDAAMGVIHIITKKGRDVDGFRTSLNYSSEDNLQVANILYGNETSDRDCLISATFTQSDGFANNGDGNEYYMWGNETDSEGMVGPPALDLSPSYELYAKIKAGDVTVKARHSHMYQSYLWIYDEDKLFDAGMKHSFLTVEHDARIDAVQSLKTSVSLHSMTYERGVPVSYEDSEAEGALDIFTEMGGLLEMIYATTLAEKHNIIAGVKAESIQVGPSTLIPAFYASTGEIVVDTAASQTFITMDKQDDNTFGTYVEDNFKTTDRFTVVLGTSYEYNDLRDKGGKVLPRFAAIYDILDTLSVKYSYTTGFNRPPAQKKLSRHFGLVEHSEDIAEHDIQIMYSGEKARVGLTVFRYDIEEFFTWGDTDEGEEGHINEGDGQSTGFECDASFSITDRIVLYGNLSYSDIEIRDAEVSGASKYLYNLGVDYAPIQNLVANLHVNGFKDMYYGIEDKYFNGEFSVDVTVTYQKIMGSSFDLSIYGKNILDEEIHTNATGWPGYGYGKGANFGIKVSYTF